MTLLLLQQVALPADTLARTAPAPETTTFIDLVMLGGWVMVPLFLLSVGAIYLFVERLITLNRAKADPEAIMERVRAYVQSGDVRGATAYCAAQDKPVTRILRQGLERLGRPIIEIRDAVQAAGKHEAYVLETRMDLLATISGIAPLLGFLGTVLGMITTFQQIQRLQGYTDPSVLAGGIWVALITTVAGLTVGIVAYFFYNFLLGRINRYVNDMERAAADFLDLLQEPTEPVARPYNTSLY